MRLQAYSQLKGKKRGICQAYYSLIERRFMCERYAIFRDMLGTASDPLVNEDYMTNIRELGSVPRFL